MNLLVGELIPLGDHFFGRQARIPELLVDAIADQRDIDRGDLAYGTKFGYFFFKFLNCTLCDWVLIFILVLTDFKNDVMLVQKGIVYESLETWGRINAND